MKDESFKDKLASILKDASELDNMSYKNKFSPEEKALMLKCAGSIRSLINLVKIYDRNIDKTIKYAVNANKELDDHRFKLALVEAVFDREAVDAINLLSDMRHKKKKVSKDGAE